jgi:hypothetical protein
MQKMAPTPSAPADASPRRQCGRTTAIAIPIDPAMIQTAARAHIVILSVLLNGPFLITVFGSLPNMILSEPCGSTVYCCDQQTQQEYKGVLPVAAPTECRGLSVLVLCALRPPVLQPVPRAGTAGPWPSGDRGVPGPLYRQPGIANWKAGQARCSTAYNRQSGSDVRPEDHTHSATGSWLMA